MHISRERTEHRASSNQRRKTGVRTDGTATYPRTYPNRARSPRTHEHGPTAGCRGEPHAARHTPAPTPPRPTGAKGTPRCRVCIRCSDRSRASIPPYCGAACEDRTGPCDQRPSPRPRPPRPRPRQPRSASNWRMRPSTLMHSPRSVDWSAVSPEERQRHLAFGLGEIIMII